MKKFFLVSLLTLSSTVLLAEPQTVTLDVPSMYCATCPYTVQLALERVEGVIEASASLEDRQAIVTFDNDITTIDALTEATNNAGYFSSLNLEDLAQ